MPGRELSGIWQGRKNVRFYVHSSLEVYSQTNDNTMHINIIKKIFFLEVDADKTLTEVEAECFVEFVFNGCQQVQHRI
jgi:hypothetical protein